MKVWSWDRDRETDPSPDRGAGTTSDDQHDDQSSVIVFSGVPTSSRDCAEERDADAVQSQVTQLVSDIGLSHHGAFKGSEEDIAQLSP